MKERESPRVVVLAPGALGDDMGKTANGLVLHARRFEVVGAVDARHAGRDAGEVVAGRARGIPVFASLDEALDRARPDLVAVGVATIGGVMPPELRRDVRLALERGVGVVSGLHEFVADDPELGALARATGATVWDVRRPPEGLRVLDGSVRRLRVPRVLVAGTDCDVGKRMATLEVLREMESRGLRVGFVATGQTGCMIGPDAGAVIDRIPGDFMSGQVERMCVDVAERLRPDVLLVYGQSSVAHPAYSGVAVACLHGAAPHAVLLAHDPTRVEHAFFPGLRMTPLAEQVRLVESLSGARVVGLALNGRNVTDHAGARATLEEETGLPVEDALRDGVRRLVDAALAAAGVAPAGAGRREPRAA